MNILIIGNGAREHAIAYNISKSPRDVNIFCVGGKKNPAIDVLSEDYLVNSVTDVPAIVKFAKEKKIDIVVVGPEAPLGVGVVDALNKVGIKCFGPTKTLARLETSKSFTRNLVEKYGIPGNPKQKTFSSEDGLKSYIEELGKVAVKSDGLCGGKGVKVSDEHLKNTDEAFDFAVECIESDGAVVIEEKLEGEEFSLIGMADGETVLTTFAIQDHKRAFDGDTGPNTGGMGTYNDENLSLPFLDEQDIKDAEKINDLVLKALEKETGGKYIGVLYGGFMKTKEGIKLIEYNARFGDPEAINIFALLESDFVDILEACVNGTLGEHELEFSMEATVVKYIVPDSYPEKKANETKIEIDLKIDGNFEMYFADVFEKDDELYFGTSRGIAVIGFGETLEEAEKEAEKGVGSISGKVRYRKDIGTKELVEKRMQHIEELMGK